MEKKLTSDVEAALATKLILEYRVPINVISKYLNKDSEELRSKIMQFNTNYNVKKAIEYVLDYETLYMKDESLELAEKQLRMFFIKFSLCKTKEEKQQLINSLSEIDETAKKIKNKKSVDLKPEDTKAIIKYRIKYALSRYNILDMFNITLRSQRHHESKIDDPLLSERVQILNGKNTDMHHVISTGRKI